MTLHELIEVVLDAGFRISGTGIGTLTARGRATDQELRADRDGDGWVVQLIPGGGREGLYLPGQRHPEALAARLREHTHAAAGVR